LRTTIDDSGGAMSKRLFMTSISTLGIALGSVGAAGSAAAAPPPCPGGFELRTEAEVLAVATPGFEGAIAAADENDNDLLCFKPLPEPIPLFEPTFLYRDDRSST
jgi:hypothetical protein